MTLSNSVRYRACFKSGSAYGLASWCVKNPGVNIHSIADSQPDGALSRIPTDRIKSRTIQSIERALDLLDILATGDSELALHEIATRSALNNSTCHHLLATLVKRGYVGRNRRTRSYFLGARIPATAILLSALTIHGVQPGPLLLTENPQVFWGLIASMYIGNAILLLLNLPMVGYSSICCVFPMHGWFRRSWSSRWWASTASISKSWISGDGHRRAGRLFLAQIRL